MAVVAAVVAVLDLFACEIVVVVFVEEVNFVAVVAECRNQIVVVDLNSDIC